MKNKKPSVLDYASYKDYLSDIYTYHKQENRSFSHRFISQKVGSSSTGWFSSVVSGRITLTLNYLHKLCSVFKLKQNEADYFELLVKYEQSKSIREKETCYKLMVGIKGVNPRIISLDSFELYDHWYISAIRELLFIIDFNNDYKFLAKQLTPSITALEAKRAIEVLKNLELIALDERGFFKPIDTVIRKDSGFKTVHWAKQLRAKFQLGVGAIDSFVKEERDLSEVYIPLSEAGFEEARKEIAILRKKLLAISERDKNLCRVYQCNFQVFPLSSHIQEDLHE